MSNKEDAVVQSWGYHAIIDAAGCELARITDYDVVWNFAKDLVRRIDMVPFGDPQIVNFGSGNKAGYTLVQLIETSNICAHFCNDTGDAYFDVFSCKPFDPKTVEDMIDWYFKPDAMFARFIYRDAGDAYPVPFMTP